MIVNIPVTSCYSCHTSYDLEEWRGLELVECWIDREYVFERRRCRCGESFATRVDGLEDLELTMASDRYHALFPQAYRPSIVEQPSWTRSWLQLVAVAAIMSAAVCVTVLVVLVLIKVVM